MLEAKAQHKANNEKSLDVNKTREKGNVVEGEDLADDDDHSEFNNAGDHRFENLIKSMLARIEIKGNLAPI